MDDRPLATEPPGAKSEDMQDSCSDEEGTLASLPSPRHDGYTRVPHKGMIVLGSPGHGVWEVWHSMTLEKKELPSDRQGPWLLEWEGDWAFVTPWDGECVIIEDMLEQELLQDKAGVYLVNRRGTSDYVNLTDKMRQFWTGKFSWKYDVVHSFEISTSVVLWPRRGFTVFFRVAKVYEALGLTSYKQLSSKWAYKLAPPQKNGVRSARRLVFTTTSSKAHKGRRSPR